MKSIWAETAILQSLMKICFAEQICGRKLNRLQSSRFLRSFRQSAVLHIVRNAVIGFQESAAIRTLKNGTECSRFSHRITDQMLIGIIVAVLNTVIANPNLLDADAEISRYTPSIEITRQQNEISRLMETPDVDFESAKEEICKLAELKYDCCTYSNKPQKTTQLREVLASHEQLNTLDIGLPQSCISRILVSHFCTVEIEFINGVVIKNIIERKMQNDHSAQCQGNSCKAANYGKQG